MQIITQPQNKFIHGIAAGAISACLFLLIFKGIPFISQFTLLPIFYIGLRDGTKNAMIAAGAAIVCCSIIVGLPLSLGMATIFLAPSIYMISRVLLHRTSSVEAPSVTTISDQQIVQAQPTADLEQIDYAEEQSEQIAQTPRTLQNESKTTQWYPAELIITQGIYTSLVMMLVLFIIVSLLIDHNLVSKMQNLEHQQYINMVGFEFTIVNLTRLLKIMPGFTALGIFITIIMNAVLAQLILVHQQKNLRPTPDFSTLELPLWPWLGLAIFGFLALVFNLSLIGDLGLNVVLVLFGAFMLQGMSIFHVFSAEMPHRNLLLWGFYLIMLVFPWLAIMVAGLGIFEPWLNLRQKVKQNFRS